MATLEERVAKLEAAIAYQDRRTRRVINAIKSAAGQLANIPAGASIGEIIQAVKSAAGQLAGMLQEDGKQ